MNYGYVYETIDKRNGMLYIGRNKGEFDSEYFGSGLIIQNILNKHGSDIFISKPIDWAKSREELNSMEKAYISAYRIVYGKESLYNISNGGECGGGVRSKETCIKISRALLGKSKSKIARLNMKIAHNKPEVLIKHKKASTGRVCKKETRDKISFTLTGRKLGPHTEEHKEKIRQGNMNKEVSSETREKIRLSRIGKKASEETKIKQSFSSRGSKNSMFGRRHTKETIEKQRKASTGKHHSKATRLKMSISHLKKEKVDENS